MLEDVAVLDTLGPFTVILADLILRRVVVGPGLLWGVLAGGTGEVHLEDVVFQDLQSGGAPDDHERDGMGIYAVDGTVVSLARVRIDRVRDFGIGAYLLGTRVEGDGVLVRDVLPEACAAVGCPEPTGGVGVAAVDQGAVSVSRFAVLGADLCGLMVARDGQFDVSDGEVASAAIGACVQVDGYDLDRLSANVRYRDNGTNLDATSLPVPSLDTSGAGP